MRHNTGCSDIAEEDFSVGAKRCNPFLDSCTTGIVHSNHRATGFERHVQHFANLEAVHLAQRASVHREILGERKHFSAVDRAVTGDHAVPRDDVLVHVKIAAPVFHQRIDLLETAVIEQQFEALTGRHLTTVVLRFNTRLSTAGLAAGLSISQVLESLFGV